MDTSFGTVRYALRQFRQAPVFAGAAILTLALGIGGTTAIFSLMHAVMLRALPVADPAELYRIGDGDNCCVQGAPQKNWGMFSYALYQRLASETPEFAQVTAFQAGSGRMSVRRERVEASARPVRTEYVTGNYFSTLGLGAFAGRLMTSDDDQPASAPVIVLSYHIWQGTYGGDPAAVGSTFMIDGHPFTAIGVTPPGFFGETLRGDPPDIWIPLQQEGVLNVGSSLVSAKSSAWLRIIGRLKPGASVDGMSGRLTGVLRQWIEHDSGYPANWMADVVRNLPNETINIVPAGAGVGVMKAQYGTSLRLLLWVCGLVLLIACANVANLLLTRAVARRQQTAVRLALGASRRQIIRQALVESVVLAIGGGIAGLFVAVTATRLLLALQFSNVLYLPLDASISLPMLGIAFSLALVTGIIFGVVPAWLSTRTNPVEALRGSGRTVGDRSSKTRTTLLVVQATLSVVLVAGAMLLSRSLNRLEGQNLGYSVDGRVLVSMNRPPADYAPERLAALYRQLEDRLRALPGVQGGGLALYNPLTDNWGELVLVAGHPPGQLSENSSASWDRVSASYLQDLGVTTLRGRAFTAADNETTAPVAVVNERFVNRFFRSDEDPLGQYFGLDLPEYVNTFRIVGIIRDMKFASFALRREARPMFFVPMAQTVKYDDAMMQRVEKASHGLGGIMLVSSMSPGQLEPLITKAIAEVDPNLTVATVRTLRQQLALSFNQERAVATLASVFGIVALLLAGVGLYGVTAYNVEQRTNEIGVRMALGADRSRVMGMVMRGAYAKVVVGLVLGIPLAIGAGKLASASLYEVSFYDPQALAIAAGALAICGFLAAVIPAARASAISPIRALRTQ